MRTEQLEYLSEIAKVKSMNKASKNLCISVQALQTSMKNLETELGFQVFDSTYKGTQLTAKGQELLNAWIVFHNTVSHLQEMPEEQRVLKGRIPIICVPGVIDAVMPQFFMEFQKYHPNAELDLITVYYEDIMGGILCGDIEYALVFSPMVEGKSMINWEERFMFVPLKDMPLYCMVNNKMRLAKQKSVSMNTLLKYDIVSWEPESERIFSMRKIYQYYAPEKEILVVKYKKIYDELLKEKNVVAIGGSINGVFSSADGVVALPISDKSVHAEFGYVKLKKQRLSSQAQIVIDMLSEYMQNI